MNKLRRDDWACPEGFIVFMKKDKTERQWDQQRTELLCFVR